jgi:uncharacterized protein (TIGR01777 family)
MCRNWRCKNDSAMSDRRIVIAGGSGFIGRALAKAFLARNFSVAILTRQPRQLINGIQEIAWDGQRLGDWVQVLDGAATVINLTGKNINCPHTPENLRAITASRVNSVKVIAAGIAQMKHPPTVWAQASATGFYGDTGDQLCTEASPGGVGALADICAAWENAFHAAATPTTRKVALRIGFVLGRDGGALPVLNRLTKLFLGGAVGNGRQYISWIHLADLAQMLITAVENKALSGTYNGVAPKPVTNAAFMRELRRACHRPWSPPVPAFAVRLGSRLLQSEASLALISCRAVPQRFIEAGFQFQFPDLNAALKDLTGAL